MWAKTPGYPYWPGRVMQEDKEKGESLVFFYGTCATYVAGFFLLP